MLSLHNDSSTLLINESVFHLSQTRPVWHQLNDPGEMEGSDGLGVTRTKNLDYRLKRQAPPPAPISFKIPLYVPSSGRVLHFSNQTGLLIDFKSPIWRGNVHFDVKTLPFGLKCPTWYHARRENGINQRHANTVHLWIPRHFNYVCRAQGHGYSVK